MNLRNNLTIIVTVHERNWTIDDCLENLKGFDCDIVIADSSKEAMTRQFDSNVKYIHEPQLNWYQKMVSRLQDVTTPLYIELPDDDSLNLDAVKKCVEFLISNQDYTVATGNSLPPSHQQQVNGFPDATISQDDSLERVTNGMSHTTGNLDFIDVTHSVNTVSFGLAFYTWYTENPILWPARWTDKMRKFYQLFYGKIKYFQIPYIYDGQHKSLLKEGRIEYPKDLGKEVQWNDYFNNPDNFKPLITLLNTKYKMSKEACINFIKSVYTIQ